MADHVPVCGGSSCLALEAIWPVDLDLYLKIFVFSSPILEFLDFEMIFYTSKSTFIFSSFNFLNVTVRGPSI
jgi:hypothetical protein